MASLFWSPMAIHTSHNPSVKLRKIIHISVGDKEVKYLFWKNRMLFHACLAAEAARAPSASHTRLTTSVWYVEHSVRINRWSWTLEVMRETRRRNQHFARWWTIGRNLTLTKKNIHDNWFNHKSIYMLIMHFCYFSLIKNNNLFFFFSCLFGIH